MLKNQNWVTLSSISSRFTCFLDTKVKSPKEKKTKQKTKTHELISTAKLN